MQHTGHLTARTLIIGDCDHLQPLRYRKNVVAEMKRQSCPYSFDDDGIWPRPRPKRRDEEIGIVVQSDLRPATPAADLTQAERQGQRNAWQERRQHPQVKNQGGTGALARVALGLALLGLCLAGSGCDSGRDGGPQHSIGEHKWSRDHGGDFFIVAPRPIVDGDVVYACASEKLLSLNLSDGSDHWSVDLGESADCNRIVHDAQSLYVLADWSVRAYGKSDGSMRWTRALDSAPHSLATGEARVYVGGYGWVISLNKDDGEVNQNLELSELKPDGDKEQWALSIVLADDMVYVTTGHHDQVNSTVMGNVLAYKTATGDYVWGFEWPTRPVNSSDFLNGRFFIRMGVNEGVISGNSIIVSASPSVISLDRFSGKVLWEKYESAAYDAGPLATNGSGMVLKDGVVYIGSLNSRVYAISANSGALRWESWASRPGNASSFVSVDDVHAYFSITNGEVHVLEVGTGRMLWYGVPPGNQHGLLRPLLDPPLVVGNECMVSVTITKVSCLSAR